MDPTEQAGTDSQNDDGAVDQTQKGGEAARAVPEKLSARDALFAVIDAKREQSMNADAEKALQSGHPMAVQVEAERRAKAQTAAAQSGSGRATETAGAADADAESSDAGAGRAATDADDPAGEGADTDAVALATHGIVMKDGKPSLKLKVDGKEQLVPLTSAVATLQKHTAAEVRLQQAAEARRQNEARAAALDAREAALAAKSSQPSAAQAAVDDQGLKSEAKALVSSLLTDSEDVAAEKLAKTLAKTRQAATPPVNAEEIVAKAAKAVRAELKQEDENKDLTTGLEKFKSEYPEIESDAGLYAVADSKTTTIASEHPEWSPSQVMLEAGRQTREWMASMGAKVPATTNTQNPSLPANGRQARKENLRPMPPTRSARQVAAKDAPPADTPASIVAEMRAKRGFAS